MLGNILHLVWFEFYFSPIFSIGLTCQTNLTVRPIHSVHTWSIWTWHLISFSVSSTHYQTILNTIFYGRTFGTFSKTDCNTWNWSGDRPMVWHTEILWMDDQNVFNIFNLSSVVSSTYESYRKIGHCSNSSNLQSRRPYFGTQWSTVTRPNVRPLVWHAKPSGIFGMITRPNNIKSIRNECSEIVAFQNM